MIWKTTMRYFKLMNTPGKGEEEGTSWTTAKISKKPRPPQRGFFMPYNKAV